MNVSYDDLGWQYAVQYVKDEMLCCLDDDYPDFLERIALDLEESWGYTEQEANKIIKEAGF